MLNFLDKKHISAHHLQLFDIEKMHVDNLAFLEMIFGILPHLSKHIKLCKSAKEIWDTLKNLL